ncbi:MAG: AI-2E family transporter [Candidatus Taylorbacteria bacterium]|nr:AI-2E family transporter [Candidatus Taylorbacteria bacterium]
MPKDSPQYISINTGTLVRTMLVVLSFGLLFYLRSVLLVVLTAVVIASSIEPFTVWLQKLHIPRLIAVIGIYIMLAVLFVGVFYFFVPSLLSDTAGFLRAIPSLLDTIPSPITIEPASVLQGANLAQTLSQGIESTTQPSALSAVFTNLSQILGSFANGFWDNVAVVFGGIVQFMLIVVLSFYLAVQEDGVAAFLRVVTPEQQEAYIIGLWKRARRKIGYWMQGQIFLAVLVGVFVYLGLTIVGIKNALFLAALSAIFEIIPLFGPVLAAIPGIGIAYASGTAIASAGVTSALLVGGGYIVIQQFENHLFYPWVVKKIVGVPPMIVILALIVGAELGGFLGILLSVPLAATLMEYLDDVQKRKQSTA